MKIPIAGAGRYFNFPRHQIRQSPFRGAIRSAPLNHTAHQAAVGLRRLSDVRWLEWFAWRGATWAYVAYLAVAIFALRRRQLRVLALVAVVAATQLNVLINNPSQLVRYMVGPLVLGILLVPLAFARRDRPHPVPETDRALTKHPDQAP